MALTINTNVASLTAQRNLSKTTLAMNRSLERLSSGLRINSAKDDAAGLAISDRMTAQIRGLNQAVRNANDGISVAQTAEGALGEMTNILQRIRELAVQSTNTTNNEDDRASLNTEVQQLIAEYGRISSQTEFNGIKVLTGDFSGNFQVGSEVGQTIAVTIDNVQGDQVGSSTNFGVIDTLTRSSNLDNFTDRLGASDSYGFTNFKINGVSLDSISTTNAHNNSLAKIDAINATSGSTGVTAFSVGNALVAGLDGTGADLGADLAGSSTAIGDIVVNGVQIAAVSTQASLVTAINSKSSDHGVHAKLATQTAGNALTLVNTTGAAITMETNTLDAQKLTGIATGTATTTVAAGKNGAIVLGGSVNASTVQFNTASHGMAIAGASGKTEAMVAQTVSSMSVSSAHNASLSMVTVDEAMMTIDTLRSKLGAVQNRLESTIANLMNVSENISAARSRIMDADIASETAIMTKNSILQQAGTAILAQANQQPQLALQLLG